MNDEKLRYALVLLSGGLDSASSVIFYKKLGYTVEGLFVDYGQAAEEKESYHADKIAKYLNIPLRKIKVSTQAPPQSGKINGRNGLLLMIALTEFRKEGGFIVMGTHAGTPYEDCSEVFVQSFQHIFDIYTAGMVQIGVPFLNLNKRGVWEYLTNNHFPIELAYSCELGLEQPCGQCLSCRDIEILYDTQK